MKDAEELEIDIEDIGTILKSNRLKSKKSLEEISQELCIRKIYLTAIEEGDYETLPPIPYGVGYVRTYARFLGLNPERAVNLYKSASITEEKEEETTDTMPQANKGNNWHAFMGLIAILTIYGGWQLLTRAFFDNNQKHIIPQEEISEIVETNKEQIVETMEILAKEQVQTISDIVKQEVAPTPDDSSDTIKAEEIVLETVPTTEEKAPKDDKKIAKDKVVVIINGETWIELKNKNKVYFSGVYHKGDRKEVDYVDNIFLSVGRPKNIEIYVDGKKRDVLAKKFKTNIPVDSLEAIY